MRRVAELPGRIAARLRSNALPLASWTLAVLATFGILLISTGDAEDAVATLLLLGFAAVAGNLIARRILGRPSSRRSR
jgi:hypothetical protein